KAAATLPIGAFNYLGQIQLGERKMEVKLKTDIRETEEGWAVSDLITLPMVEMSDASVLDKNDLTLLKRAVKQGPVTIETAFRDNRVQGKMNMGNGQEQPIDADVGGALFADGAGFQFVIAALPLAEGYSTTYRNFDLQQQKVKLLRLTVSGSEEITVPAGTFDAYRLEVSSADGGPEKTTIWVSKEGRKPVKTSSVLPGMGGAVMTLEMQ
ncbi:MAG TPA: DUF3108 domain-containing protein, partial [Acidobacteriota bacterium]|nr:DUF3108 domain-containing protein [Acidobacteriota bacterium]